MEDYRETLVRDFGNSLTEIGITDKRIVDRLVVILNDYEITPRCTDLATIDTASEKVLMLYLASIKTEGKRDKTVKLYSNVLRRFMNEVGKPLTDVCTMDIRVWLAKVQQNASLRTCENYRAYLSAFYTWLLTEGIIQTNPMLKIKPISYDNEVKTSFTDVEIDKLRTACENDYRMRAILEFLLSSGVRLSELCQMEISDINFSTNEVIVREGKGGKQRKTYINSICSEYLKKYLLTRSNKDNTALFVSNHNRNISKSFVESNLHKLGEKSGVDNVHPHRFRRTFASNLAKKGMDVRTIQILMGHTNLNTTMVYMSLSDEHIQNEYRRFA